MDLEMQDILEKKYKNLCIEVSYKDVRKYNIKLWINNKNIMYETLFLYNYDTHYTINYNCDKIEEIIDKIILDFYKKGV